MATLTRMTSSIGGIKKRMEKLVIVQQKVDNLVTRIESMEKKFIEIKFKQKHLRPKAVIQRKYGQKIKT